MTIIGVFASYFLTKRWNQDYGLDDMPFVFFIEIFEKLGLMLFALPLMGLITKIIPKGIEGSTFALLTSVDDFALTILRPAIGSWLNNQFVGVTKDDLSQYDKLCLIALVCSIAALFPLRLIPTKMQIEEFKS